MTHIDVHGGKARPESTRSIQKDSGEMRGGPERKSRQGSLSPAVRGGRSSEVPVRGWRHSYGVGSPSGQRPHLCPERRRVSGWPGPRPAPRRPTRDARHLPAHLPALSSQPPALSGCHCSSFCGNTECCAWLGTSSGSHQPSAGALTTRATAPAAKHHRQMQAWPAGNFANTLAAPCRVPEAVATAVLSHKPSSLKHQQGLLFNGRE